MNAFNVYACQAKVLDLYKENDKDVLILDRTAFYPQGGGQPYDKGIITNSAKFLVEEVRFVDGVVKHIGRTESGNFTKDEVVECMVDQLRRDLHSALHSAGHVVDLAVRQLNFNWIPGKGYHFPEGPYVEYSGDLESVDKEKLKTDLENICNALIAKGCETKLMFVTKDQLQKLCDHVSPHLPENKPIRVVMYGDIAIPCGGTHVQNISEIKKMTIRKLKMEKGNIRVSYDIVR
jgi:Ser-tRNA(Ala) deacylase AlaX